MTHPDGGFYSAEDADSEGVEGKFYVWSQGEIEHLLDRQTASIVIPFYNVTQPGNWEHNNILNVTRSPEQLAKEQGLDTAIVKEEIAKGRKILLEGPKQAHPPPAGRQGADLMERPDDLRHGPDRTRAG